MNQVPLIASDWLAARARVTPEKLALMIGDRRWTYGALNTAVSRLAGHLHARGVRPGARLGMLLPGGLTAVCLIHAAARLGAVLVPLNTRLTPAELAWQAAEAGLRQVAADQEGRVENCELVLVTEQLLETAAPFTIHDSPFTIHHFQSLVFTSGTSGRPKAAMLTFANHFWSATASSYRLGLQPDDLWLSVLPLYHVGGLAVLFRSCLYGTAVDLHPRFDLDAVNHALDTKPITLISLVPTMLHRLLATRSHWPATLRLILLGGAAAPPELVARANALPRSGFMAYDKRQTPDKQFPLPSNPFPLVAPTYGLTEAASQVATMLPADAARKPGSVGKPLMFTQVRIVDEQGQDLPSNAPGEIVISGPTLMAGYDTTQSSVHERPSTAAAAEIPHPLTELRTGDVGYLDADGDLFVLQRRSDLIVSGGENVYPAEVEAVLRQHPAVEAVCVVGLPDAEWGQRVAAMVQVAQPTAVSPEQLLAFSRARLAGYKQPRLLRLVDAIPHTASGKIARRAVQDQLLQEVPDA